MSFSPKKVLVPVADGTEPIEAVITVDVLQRSDADVTVASVADRVKVDACYSVKIVADALLSDCAFASYDLVALPVGFKGRRLKVGFRVGGDEDLEASVEEEPVDEICSAQPSVNCRSREGLNPYLTAPGHRLINGFNCSYYCNRR